MGSKNIRIQVIVLFLLILANFIAQIPYYLHLYYNPNNLLAQARGGLVMLFVFGVFLLASILLWNTLGEVIHGYGLFFHLTNPDLLLRVVFAIGYVNLFASGYFLGLLLLKRARFIDSDEREKPLQHDIIQYENEQPAATTAKNARKRSI